MNLFQGLQFKKKMSTIADKNKFFGEFFLCFDNTNKPYSICAEYDKVKANTKYIFEISPSQCVQ